MTNAEALAAIVTNFGGTVTGEETIADLLTTLSGLVGDSSVVTTSYELPKASASVLGGVKVGTNLSIDSGGVLSATDTTYSAATTDALGLVKVDGTTITINDGVISVVGG